MRETIACPHLKCLQTLHLLWLIRQNNAFYLPFDIYLEVLVLSQGSLHQLFTARASSAGIERVFSTFGLVHSKLRNRLGTQKAGKLVFMYKVLNTSFTG